MATKRPFKPVNGIQIDVSDLNINSSTATTSTTTGAITVSGGVGIGQSISIGGRLQIFNGSNYSAFRYAGSANTTYTLPTNSPQSAAGTSVLSSTIDGILSWVPMTATGGGGAGTVDQGAINSIAYYPSAGTLVTGLSSFTFTGTGMSNSFGTNSASITTGALTILGGVGITGNAFIGGTVIITNTTNSIPSDIGQVSGALAVQGGVGIGGSLFVGSQLGVGGTVDYSATNAVAYFTKSSNTYTQVIVHNHSSGNNASSDYIVSNDLSTDASYYGDFGINSSGWAATTQAFNTANATYLASSNGDLAIGSLTANNIRFFYNNGINDIAQFTGNDFSIHYGTNSTGTTSGAFYVKGGVGITGNAFIGGTFTLTNTTNSTSSSTGSLVLSGGAGVAGTINIGQRLTVGSTLNSTSTTTGALVNSGGLGMAGNAFIGGTITISDTTNSTSSSTGSLVVSGGAGVAGTINIGQRLTVGSTLNSTSTTTGALVNSGGLGMAGNAFIGGTITLSDTTNSTSSSTGSLVLSGGAGFGKSINVGGNVSARSGFGLRAFNSADTNFSGFVYTGASNLSYTLPTAYPSTSGQVLSSDTSGVMSWASTAGFGTVNQKSISIFNPVSNDEITLMHVFEPITIVQFETVSRGSGAALTYFVNYNTDRSSAIGTTVVLGGTAHTAGLAGTTTGQALTTFTNSAIGSNNFIWLKIGTVSGTMTEFHFTMHYRKS